LQYKNNSGKYPNEELEEESLTTYKIYIFLFKLFLFINLKF